MKEKNKQTQHPEEEVKTTSGWKKMLRKKWFFPAVYLAAAALILALITWYQNPNDFAIDRDELGYDQVDFDSAPEEGVDQAHHDEGAVPVTSSQEEMIWPVAQDEEVQVVLSFYDDNASEEEQMNAMVEFDRSYHPSQGISISREDNEAFDVIAALSGTVVAADKDPLVGFFVEIEHDDGLVTIYQSLEDLKVAEGDQVKQGDFLGRAGKNLFHQELGVHVHFQVRENGIAVNPDQHLAKAEEQ
jgi:stage II sporulation protein Q